MRYVNEKQSAISPLFMARRENAGLIKNICLELETAMPRNLIGEDWSLALFLKSDMKNYSLLTHFVLDVGAFAEKDDEFINLLEGIDLQAKNDATIILYCDGFHAGDEFLHKLVKKGYTNIVADYDEKDEKKNMEKKLEDLKECFESGLSEEKYRRYDNDLRAKPKIEIVTAMLPEINEKSYENAKIGVAIMGARSRMGVTTLAIRIADYFALRKGKVAFLLSSSGAEAELPMMAEILGGEKVDSHYRINNIDFYLQNQEKDIQLAEYNVIIADFGKYGNKNFESSEIIFNKLLLVGGTAWSELLDTINMQKEYVQSFNYTLCINFSDKTNCDKLGEYLSVNENDCIVMPTTPGQFNVKDNELIFDNEFCEFADEKEREVEETIA